MAALAGRLHLVETEHFEEAARILARLDPVGITLETEPLKDWVN
ncbi:hypothetical protein ACH4NT_12630 [Streptomyces lydicus]